MTATTEDYVDVRAIHPDYRLETCWNCGHERYVKRQWRVCHECFMGQQANDDPSKDYVTDEGYTDYGKLWYGEVDDREEYQEIHERETASIRETIERRKARERTVRL